MAVLRKGNPMSSKKEIINFQSGVTLTKTTLFNGAVAVAEAYTVVSNQTPEVKTFEGRIEADAYFALEVARSSQQ